LISAAAAKIKTITTSYRVIHHRLILRSGSQDHLQAARFMHMSIINVHGRAAMMRNTSAPVSQFEFQTTLKEVAAAKRIYNTIR
jgi:hypothetical protein